MKRAITLLVFASLICVFLFAGVVLAANENASDKALGSAKDNETSAKNMTYGQCVVAGVQLKNACYNATKAAKDSCVASAGNDSVAAKQCAADYKKDMTQCKADFKTAKKECIKTTKPGMWTRLRYGLA